MAHADPAAPRQVDLAREQDFRLGPLQVRPSTCQVLAGDRVIDLQPKVMQVLVVLAGAQGRSVSREELLAACWGEVVVGDDSIHRCIARLRRLSEQDVPGAFTITTQARVGYRLFAEDPVDDTLAGDTAPAAGPTSARPGGGSRALRPWGSRPERSWRFSPSCCWRPPTRRTASPYATSPCPARPPT